MGLPVRIEHSLDAAVQGPHDSDARKHRRSARRRDQDPMKIEPSSDHVKALLDSASRATQALGGKTEGRD